MLTKDFQRTFIPGRPGSPEIPARAAYTVCYTPPSGHWETKCSRIDVPLDMQGSVTIPPGGHMVVVYDPSGAIDPNTGQVKVIDIYIEVCASEWVDDPGSPTPICTTYPAQPYVPAVPAVPSRMDISPIVGWNAGANSVTAQSGDCVATWTMGRVVGAYIGLTQSIEDVTPPARLSHAFYFHQKSGRPLVRVVESGEARTSDFEYAPGDEFSIRRARGGVTFFLGGMVVYESSTASVGEVRAGCALYASGDQVPSSGDV